MLDIGNELQDVTRALSLPGPNPGVLGICMAPGGYSASALKYSPHAHVSGITLPRALGGHRALIPYGNQDSRVHVKFADITMLAAEFGVTNIPEGHPDISNFSTERPWAAESIDLVFCDGIVLRTHIPHVASYREKRESTRLTCSQLILAMQRIKPRGTFIMLLHKPEMWKTMGLLSIFDKISHIELFKPVKSHKNRSSFYLIAKNVQPNRPEAVAAINEWKAAWKNATFPSSVDEKDCGQPDFVETHVPNEEVSNLLASLGEPLIELGEPGEPVWQIQKEALKKAPWIKNTKPGLLTRSAEQSELQASHTPAHPADASSMMHKLQIGR